MFRAIANMQTKIASVARSLGFLLLCPLILILTGPLTKVVYPAGAPLVAGTVAGICTFGLTYVFVRWDRSTLESVGAAIARGSLLRIAAGIFIGFTLVAFQVLTIKAGGHAHWRSDRHLSLVLSMKSLAGYVALAAREELAFRGYPLRRLERVWGSWPAVLFVSAVFALEHVAGGWNWSRSLFGPLAGGLMFGVAALATRGLALPLGIHCGFNFAQWMMGQKEIPGLWQPMIDPGFERQAEVLGYTAYVTGTALIVFALWLYSKRPMGKHAEPAVNLT